MRKCQKNCITSYRGCNVDHIKNMALPSSKKSLIIKEAVSDTISFAPPYSGFVTALKKEISKLHNPIVLCIGSDRLTGDCLGPLVGNALVETHNLPTYVYGTLSRTVTALNLDKTVQFIKNRHPHSSLLVVDASLGVKADIGQIRIKLGGIRPGSASGKDFSPVGDVSITAVVNCLPSSTLSSTKLGFVHALSHVIGVGIASSMDNQSLLLCE